MGKSNGEKLSMVCMVWGIILFATGVAYHPSEVADDTQGPLVAVGLILVIGGLTHYVRN